MRRAIIICDIDRVIVDSREWEKHIPKDFTNRAEWNEFLKYHYLAKPNKVMINLLSVLGKVFPIFFVTARENFGNSRKIAKQQINQFSNGLITVGPLNKHKLFMRDKDDFREAPEVKEDILVNQILPEFQPILAIDDDKGNIDMYKKHGIRTFHYRGLLK